MYKIYKLFWKSFNLCYTNVINPVIKSFVHVFPRNNDP